MQRDNTMKHQFYLRPEKFGATVYNPKALSYFFINQEQLAQLSKTFALTDKSFPLPEVTKSAPSTDFSNGKFSKMLGNRDCDIKVKSVPGQLPTDTLAAPVRVYFEITTRCNAACHYCLNDSGSIRPGELSSEEVFKAIEKMANDGVFEVRLTGGEPTLRRHFFDFAHQVKQQGMTLSLNSNLLGKDRTIARLANLKPALLITSIDAAEQPHTRLRGPGFKQVVKNIHYLREEGVPLRLNCVLSKETLPYIEPFIDQFAPIGCGFCFILTRPVGRAGGKLDSPSIEEFMICVQKIEKKRKAYPDIYFSTSFHVVMERELIIGVINLTGCNAIQKSFNINSDGTVLPCAFLYELSAKKFTLGNIRDNDYSILQIWRESKRLHDLRCRSADCNQRCIACKHFHKDCLGTCVFMELYSQLTGNPDPYCKINRMSQHTTMSCINLSRNGKK